MPIVQQIPEAIAKLAKHTPIASGLDTAGWADVPLALRQRAFFSSKVTQLDLLIEMQKKLTDSINLRTEDVGDGKRAFVDRSSFIGDMRSLVQDMGLSDGSGELTDLASQKRLGLIFQQNLDEAFGYARDKAGKSEGALEAFPAQELIRIEERIKHRDWASIWLNAGGQFYGGRMIALKTDPIWTEISRFGTPWPPFDFGSGMGLQDVDWDEAEALGLVTDDTKLESDEAGFNDKLEASVDTKQLPASIVKSLLGVFGDSVQVSDGKLQWTGGAS